MKTELNINLASLPDNTEKTWFLGTDVCADPDLGLMERGIGASLVREEGAMYHVGFIKTDPQHYTKLGYSEEFQALMQEALNREYVWIFFDRDIYSF